MPNSSKKQNTNKGDSSEKKNFDDLLKKLLKVPPKEVEKPKPKKKRKKRNG